jgi:uncharacterized protein with HEPN domain
MLPPAKPGPLPEVVAGPDILGTLEHIHEAAGFIEADTRGLPFAAFMSDRRTRQVVERNFVIIGEAVSRLLRHAPDVAERVSASNEMVGFCNQLAYDYDQVDYPTLWRAVQETLPELRAEVEMLLSESESCKSPESWAP